MEAQVSITISRETHERLKALAEPFVDNEEAVIARLLDQKSAQQADGKPRPKAITKTSPKHAARFTRVLHAELNRTEVRPQLAERRLSWATVVEAVAEAMSHAGTTDEEVLEAMGIGKRGEKPRYLTREAANGKKVWTFRGSSDNAARFMRNAFETGGAKRGLSELVVTCEWHRGTEFARANEVGELILVG